MEDIPFDQPPQEAPLAVAGSAGVSLARPSSGGCLVLTSLTLAIVSILLSVIIIGALLSNQAFGTILVLAIYGAVWLFISPLAGVISCICAVVYAVRTPLRRGWGIVLILIGVLALSLDVLTFMLFPSR
jgi:hypothetical protein